MSNEPVKEKIGGLSPLLITGKSEAVIGENLTLKQELFCRYYTQNEELFGNATLSYAHAYGIDLDSLSREPTYSEDGKTLLSESEFKRYEHNCGANASRLLRNDRISKRIVKLLNEMMSDEVVDAQLFRIIQSAAKPSDRVAAIKEYNSLKQRITKKLDLTTKGESINLEDRNKVEKALESLV